MNKNRAGFYRENLYGSMSYKSFVPNDLADLQLVEFDKEMMELLVLAHKNLAILDEKAKLIPDIDLFISMYVQKEALISSQIEGTQATLEDIFNPTIDKNKNLEVLDVVNYTNATNYGVLRLRSFPLCNRLILELHEILLRSVRGSEKNPGEFRNSQNWIGATGSSINNATYIPPSVDDMKTAMYRLETYMNSDDILDVLVRAALIHYQFETIHPFLDGNGRIGRLLVILYLLEKKEISTPCLYFSYYLKRNRVEYYDRMTAVRETGNYEQWIKFFVRGIVVSADEAIKTSKLLIELRQENINKITGSDFTNKTKKTLLLVYNYLEKKPIVDIKTTADALSLAYNTVSSAIKRLEEMNILEKIGSSSRNKVYAYREYIDILKTGTEIT